MPIIKSAIKRVKQAAKRRDQNIVTKKNIKAATKAFVAKPTAKGLSEVQSAIDTAVKKNVLAGNTAARRKAQYARIAKEAGVKLEGAKKSAPKSTSKVAAAKPAAEKKAPAKKPTTKKPAAKKTTK